MSVPRPKFLVTYEAKDVSDELAPFILSVDYTDNLKGKADELALTVENRDGRWLEGWFPAKGDRIGVKFGFEGEPLLDSGRFAVDDVELAVAPDTVTIRALAAPMTDPFRTKQTRGFDGVTLLDVAQFLARELELELAGDVAPVRVDRITQNGETNLAFLHRLFEAYGYAFSVRPPKLTIYEIAKLETGKPVLQLRRRDLAPGARFKSQTHDTYVACEVKFFDPKTKAVRKVRVEAKFAREKVIVSGAAADDLRGVPTVPTRLLKEGVTGDDVRRWQTFLSERGHDPGPIDGIFGPKTRAGTLSFQRASSLAADGIAGPDTFRVALEQGFGEVSPHATGLRVEPAGAVLRKEIRVETVEQAEIQARALLDAANRLRATGSFSVQGRTRLVSGATLELLDLGRLSGKYSVQTSRHHMTRSGGYTTDAEVTFV